MSYEGFLLWTGLFGYLLGFALVLAGMVFSWRRLIKPGWYVSLLAFLFHTGSIAARWLASGHPPVEGNYENALLGTWFVGLIALYSGFRLPKTKEIVVFVNPLILLLLGMALNGDTEVAPLSAPYQSNWLWIHVSFAWLGFSSFFIAFFLGIVYLYKDKHPKEDSFTAGFASPALLEDLLLGFIIFGFITQALQIAAGSIWAASLWGSYWSWDPIETWSLICWLTYGVILHLRFTYRWRGKRLAWLAILAVITEVISFWGLGIVSGPHTSLL